jgi:hypothetical protein
MKKNVEAEQESELDDAIEEEDEAEGEEEGDYPSTCGEIEVLAQRHAAEAIDELVRILARSKSDVARVAASIAILNRAYGKPSRAKDDWLADRTQRMSVKKLLADWARAL